MSFPSTLWCATRLRLLTLLILLPTTSACIAWYHPDPKAAWDLGPVTPGPNELLYYQVGPVRGWTIGSGEVSLSTHLVVDPGPGTEALLERVRGRLSQRFSIDHTTIQIEQAGPDPAEATACQEACEPTGQPA